MGGVMSVRERERDRDGVRKRERGEEGGLFDW